jgi:hypothetical protein
LLRLPATALHVETVFAEAGARQKAQQMAIGAGPVVRFRAKLICNQCCVAARKRANPKITFQSKRSLLS